jgi:hypothetical protein
MLQIAYGVGKLSEKFSQGDLVLDGTYLIAKRGDPLVVTFVSVDRFYKQYVDSSQRAAMIASGLQPKTYNTREEALKAGEIVDWSKVRGQGPRPTVSPAGFYQLLIQKPNGIECALFGFELGGKLWAPARMYLDKKAHRVVNSEVEKAMLFSLGARKGGLLAGQFTLFTKTTKKPDSNTETLPEIRFSGNNSDADVAKILTTFQNAAGSGADEDQGD